MIRITFNDSYSTGAGLNFVQGKTYSLPDGEAQVLIRAGVAVPEEETRPASSKADSKK